MAEENTNITQPVQEAKPAAEKETKPKNAQKPKAQKTAKENAVLPLGGGREGARREPQK